MCAGWDGSSTLIFVVFWKKKFELGYIFERSQKIIPFGVVFAHSRPGLSAGRTPPKAMADGAQAGLPEKTGVIGLKKR